MEELVALGFKEEETDGGFIRVGCCVVQGGGCDRERFWGEGDEGVDVGVGWWAGNECVGVYKQCDAGWVVAVAKRLGCGGNIFGGISGCRQVNPGVSVLEIEVQRTSVSPKVLVFHVMGVPCVIGMLVKWVCVCRLVEL